MAWGKAGSTTLSTAGDTITVSGMTASKTNQFLLHIIPTGTVDINLTFDNNSNTDYARRQSYNGGSDSTNTSESFIQYSNNVTVPQFCVLFGVNIDSKDKLFIMFQNRQGTAGAGTAPDRYEMVSKIDTTTNTGQYTRIDNNNPESGSYDTDSNVSVLGSDVTPAAAVPPTVIDGSIFYETDTKKEYVLYNSTWTEV